MLVAKQITFNLWLIRHFKTPPIPTDGKLFASKIGSLDQVWPFSAANDPIIWRPSNLTNLGRAPFYGLQPTWGGVRFLGGSPHLATAVVIREVQIGDFSHSRHSHLPHLGAQLVWGCWGISLKYALCLRQWRKICQLLFIALSFEDDSLNNFNVML